MNALEPLVWVVGLTLCVLLFTWAALRAIRWAKKGSKTASLLGLGMDLANPQPPPRIHLEELKSEIRGKKSADSADPKR
jgi:hypothetical protein